MRIARLFAELAADVCHIDLQLLNGPVVRLSPDGLNDGGIGHHLAVVFGQEGEDVVFGLRQLDFAARERYAARIIVNGQIVEDRPPGSFAASLIRLLRSALRTRASSSAVLKGLVI